MGRHQCIFCLKDADRLSEEHIFPAALGGIWALKNGSHGSCNGGFSKAEKLMADELRPIRNFLQVPDRRGDIPPAEATFKVGDEEYKGRVLGDGTLQPKPVVSTIVTETGGREIRYKFLTPALKAQLQQLVASGKGEFIQTPNANEPLRAEIGVGGEILHVGTNAGTLVAAKIAYVGLAAVAGTKTVAGVAFDDIRARLLIGDVGNASRIFVNRKYFESVQQGPHQHSLTLSACHDRMRVDAIVRLFGQMSYFVVLSDCYEGADFFKTVIYDASRGEANGMIVNLLDIEAAQTQHVFEGTDTQWDDLFGWGTQFAEYLKNAIRNMIVKSPILRSG
jgi:hypothetical protein